MTSHISITARYLPPTNTRCARVKLTTCSGRSKVIDYDHDKDGVDGVACAWLAAQGLLPSVVLGTVDGYVIGLTFSQAEKFRVVSENWK